MAGPNGGKTKRCLPFQQEEVKRICPGTERDSGVGKKGRGAQTSIKKTGGRESRNLAAGGGGLLCGVMTSRGERVFPYRSGKRGGGKLSGKGGDSE